MMSESKSDSKWEIFSNFSNLKLLKEVKSC